MSIFVQNTSQGHSQDICDVEANAISIGRVPKARAGGRAREGAEPPSHKGGSGISHEKILKIWCDLVASGDV